MGSGFPPPAYAMQSATKSENWLPGWVTRTQPPEGEEPACHHLRRARITAAGILPAAQPDPRRPCPDPPGAQKAAVVVRLPVKGQAGRGGYAPMAGNGAKTADAAHPPPDAWALVAARLLVDRYIRLIQRNIGPMLILADLARELGVTIGILDRACLWARGRPALALLYAIRLERAVHSLRHGTDSVPHIAAHLGFAGVSHMNRAFMAATGRPAEDFRRPAKHHSS